MFQVMCLFRNKFDGSNISIHPHFTKNRIKLRTWVLINSLHLFGEVHCTLRYLQRLCSIGVDCRIPRVTLLYFGITWEDQLPLQLTFSNGWFVLDIFSKLKEDLKCLTPFKFNKNYCHIFVKNKQRNISLKTQHP